MALDFLPLLALGTFLAALILPGILRPLLLRTGLMDIPNERSSHSVAAIRGAGLAPVTSLGIALVVLLLMGEVDRHLTLMGVCVVVLGASLIGMVEDAWGISRRFRAMLQVFVGFSGTTTILVGLNQSLWWLPLGVIIIAIYINVANFMDGINGISGGHGMIVGLHYVVVGSISEIAILTILGALLSVVFMAFLPWNLIHGRMFLGDVGSYMLGGSVAILSILALTLGIHPVAVVAPVSIYLVDTGTTLLRRLRNGENWTEPHRSHLYQRLTNHGWAHWQASLVVTAFGLLSGALGLLALGNPLGGWVGIFPLVISMSYGYVVFARKMSGSALQDTNGARGTLL